MNKDIEALKERIIVWVDERDKTYVTSLLNGLEKTTHEHSFDSGYETGYDKGWIDRHEMGNYSSD